METNVFEYVVCYLGVYRCIWYIPIFQSDLSEKGQSWHYNGVILGAIASQITSLTIVHSTVYSDADQRRHQSSASVAFVRGIQQGPVNSPHKWPVTRKMFPFDDVLMIIAHTIPVGPHDHRSVSNHRCLQCLLNGIFKSIIKKISTVCYTDTVSEKFTDYPHTKGQQNGKSIHDMTPSCVNYSTWVAKSCTHH